MIVLDRLLIGGIRFVLDKVASAVDSEMNDEGALREQLLAAQMRLELGEIEEAEFAEIEADVLALDLAAGRRREQNRDYANTPLHSEPPWVVWRRMCRRR